MEEYVPRMLWLRFAVGFAGVGLMASLAMGQVGQSRTVKETGGPLMEISPAVRDATGPVKEAGQPLRLDSRGSIGGVPVSAGSRGVYGSGCVRDGSAGSVADMNRIPVEVFLPMAATGTLAPMGPANLEELHRIVTRLDPTAAEEADHHSPPAESPMDTAGTSPPENYEPESGAGEPLVARRPSQATSDVSDSESEAGDSPTSTADEGQLLLGGEPTE